MRFVLAALALALIATPAHAQLGRLEQIMRREANTFTFPGPEPGQPREVFVWRPQGHSGVLPVVYVTDGPGGMMMVLEETYAPMMAGEAPPFMIVAIQSERRIRRREYVPRERTMRYFEAHRDWFLNVVMPWAEATQGASRQRAHRIIGGASNGADFAVAMAAQRPDLFGGILAHSPMNPERGGWTRDTAPTQRWVVTAGRQLVDADFARVLSRELTTRNAPHWFCLGPWGHNLASWTPISRGSVFWLFGEEEAATRLRTGAEQTNCQTLAG